MVCNVFSVLLTDLSVFSRLSTDEDPFAEQEEEDEEEVMDFGGVSSSCLLYDGLAFNNDLSHYVDG